MPTVIDALLITLGLDASKYKDEASKVQASQAGIKKAAEETASGGRRATEEARRARAEALAASREAEERSRHVSNLVSGLRNQIIGVFAVFTAGRGLTGLIREITNTDEALGYLARNAMTSVGNLTVWQGAAERVGGTAGATGQTILGLAQNFSQFQLTGQSSVLPYFRALGVQFTGRTQDLLNMSRAVQGMDRGRANVLLAGAGIDPGTANLILEGPEAIRLLIAEQERLGHAMDGDAARAREFNNSLRNLTQTFDNVFRTVFNHVSPIIVDLLKQFETWLNKTDELGRSNKQIITDAIIKAISDFVTWLEKIDWVKVRQGFSDFATGVKTAADQVGGLTTALEVMFGLWLGAKFLGMMTAIRTMGAALLGIRTATAAGAGVGAAAAGGGVAGFFSSLGRGLLNAAPLTYFAQQMQKPPEERVGSNGMTTQQFRDRLRNGRAPQAQLPAPEPGAGRGTYAIGDSIAAGIQTTNRTAGGGVVGANPQQVLDAIRADPTSLQGHNVVLSSGISNNPQADFAIIQQQLAALRARGASNINLMGTGSRPDLDALNPRLQQFAQQNGVNYVPFQAGSDQVHPGSYQGLGMNFPGSAASPQQRFPGVQMGPDGTYRWQGTGQAPSGPTPTGTPVTPPPNANQGAPQSYHEMLNLIGRAEGTDRRDGYNETLGYGAFTPGGAGSHMNLTGMTLNQVLALQGQMLRHPDNTLNSSAVGRYQIVGQTLGGEGRTGRGGLMGAMGLSGNELFDERMQDRMAQYLIQYRMRQPDPVHSLGQEWQSFAHRRASPQEIESAMGAIRGGPATAAAAAANPVTPATPSATPSATPDALSDALTRLRNQAPVQRPDWYRELPTPGAGRDQRSDNGSVTHDNSQSTEINGPITIHTAATDADGMARDMRDALRQRIVSPSNVGLV